MRRKPGTLIEIELAIIGAAINLQRAGQATFHGYAVAREIRDDAEARRLTAHGTLYRALDRLEKTGMLDSELEDAAAAEAESRPRRRLYRLTAGGARAFEAASVPVRQVAPSGLRDGQTSS